MRKNKFLKFWINMLLNVILTLIFILVFIPVGIFLKLCGKDHLDRRIDRAAASYWRKRRKEKFIK